jgi:hypothetical protein
MEVDVAVGAGIVPEYDGAGDMRVLPFITGEIHLGIVNLEMRGQRLRLDLNPGSRLSTPRSRLAALWATGSAAIAGGRDQCSWT